MSWNYVQPVEIIFKTGGLNDLAALCEERGFKKAVMVCDPYFAAAGFGDKVNACTKNRVAATYSEITPNPRTSEVNACAALMKKTGADFAIALGGGSALDCAKLACALATCDEPAEAFHSGGKTLSGNALPLIAIPTTAGTGSEVTSVAVLTDTERGIKAPIGHRSMYPKIALIDPELTLSLPPKVTAMTGLDALSHALEAFWSKNHQPACDAFALHAARLVFDWLIIAYENGGNVAAREKMCEASVIAGLAFALPKTAAAHAISFPLTNIYGLPHGEACAFTLDSLCEINAAAENGRVEEFARKLGFSGASEMGARITELKRLTGMRSTLSEAGIPQDGIQELARLSRHPNLDNNPVKLDEEALIALFRSKDG